MNRTRRTFLVGGGAAVATLAFWTGAIPGPGAPRASDDVFPTSRDSGAYVDVDGWMLSPADQALLTADGGGGEAR